MGPSVNQRGNTSTPVDPNAFIPPTKEELHQVIAWLTGFEEQRLLSLLEENVTFGTFFQQAKMHPNAHMIKGVVCGYRIEEIDEEYYVYKQCRRMEKLIDELAKGRKIEKILRKV